jgi:hypothetical protein
MTPGTQHQAFGATRKNAALLFVRKTLASCTVNESLPTVTVIIAAQPDMAEVRAVAEVGLFCLPASVRIIDTFCGQAERPSCLFALGRL